MHINEDEAEMALSLGDTMEGMVSNLANNDSVAMQATPSPRLHAS